ncbi:MAG: hypothetical protein JKY56_00880 [Kofleriaceae bacterium]|nr:hypothetical protein [Kofleriaceae bacterium]
MITRYIVGGLLIAASSGTVACGTNSDTVGASHSTPSAPLAQPVVDDVAPEKLPIEAVVVPEIKPPIPGVVTQTIIHRRIKDGSKTVVLGKQCTLFNDVCDTTTIALTLDGNVLSFQANDAAKAAPFGQWQALRAEAAQGGFVLRVKHEEELQHIHVQIDNGTLTETTSMRFPRTLSKTFPTTLDFDGDGQADTLRLTCSATYYSNLPTACKSGFKLWLNDSVVYENQDLFAEFKTIELLAFTHKNVAAVRISAPLDGEGEATFVTILSSKDGTLVESFSENVFGALTWKDNGSFTLHETICDRPARLKYFEKREPKVLAYGRERYRNNQFTWDGQSMTNQESKKWKKRRSECQTEGRCPYVYAGNSDTKLGEILRDLVGTKNWKNQSLEIPRSLVEDGKLSVLISEEKFGEVTYIDAAWLMVGDTRIVPSSCPQGLCMQDTKTMSLAKGDSIRLQFEDLPADGTIRLFANGYYLYQ